MTTDDATGQWPAEDLWPDDDAPPAEWARFYRDHLGKVVLPTPGPMDTIGHARSIARRTSCEFADKYGREPTDEESIKIWTEARDVAERARKGPIGYFALDKFQTAADVTDKWIATWWEPVPGDRGPRGEADQRGICIRPSQSAVGLPLLLVDVDPRHGGDVAGEWGAGLPGPKASSASGDGVHTFCLAVGKEHNSQGRLAPGVDVVARGTPILVPAGSATPTRRWLSKAAPLPSPEPLRRPPPPRARDKRPARKDLPDGYQREPGDDEDDAGDGMPGRTAALVAADVGDGERNDAAADIVGMLARPRACPPDFVRACLELLAEEMAGRDAPRAEVLEDSARWRLLLTRGPRDADFAAEVLSAWIRVRQVAGAGRAWSESDARRVARSMWKTCDRHEEGLAGAEDYGVGPVLAHAAPGLAPPGGPSPAVEATPVDLPSEPAAVPYPPPSPEVAAAAVAASVAAPTPKWRGGVDPRLFAPTLGEDYTREHLQRDLLREPIRIDSVMPAVDFRSGVHSTSPDLLTPPITFGWGPHLAAAKRGLSAGEFVAVGASSAGAGKTTFLAWLVNGLALQTAMRLLGAPGYAERPLVLPIWASEMPKRNELYGRLVSAYLGFHRACLDDGPRASEAPGVLAAATDFCMTGDDYVLKARAMEDWYGNNPASPLCIARHHVVRRVDPGRLPRHSRRDGVTVHHRSGPDLVEHLADVVSLFREELAARAGVSTDKVLPVVVVDPVQRFAGGGPSEKGAIDAILGALNDVLCRELECVVVATSDTTKAAARGVSLDAFLSAEAPALMADVFAGSQGIIHHASDVIAVHPESNAATTMDRAAQDDPGRRIRAGCVRMWTRLLRSRGGGESPLTFPYEWDRALGRLNPRTPEPLRAAPPAEHQQGAGGRRPFVPPPAMGHGGPKFNPAPRPSFSDDLAD